MGIILYKREYFYSNGTFLYMKTKWPNWLLQVGFCFCLVSIFFGLQPSILPLGQPKRQNALCKVNVLLHLQARTSGHNSSLSWERYIPRAQLRVVRAKAPLPSHLPNPPSPTFKKNNLMYFSDARKATRVGVVVKLLAL